MTQPSAAFAGKVALITGAASGIGLATARRLAQADAIVWIGDFEIDGGKKAASILGGRSLQLDVASPDHWDAGIERVLQESGKLDVLVNAAGVAAFSGPQPFEDLRIEDWRRVFAVNVEGAFLGCQAAVKAMRGSGGGAIVNIASTAGVHSTPTLAAYGAAKAAVMHMTRTVAAYCALRSYAIRCNAVLPGMIDTPMNGGLPPERRSGWEAQIPMHRFGRAEEVAEAIAFLASDAASYVTGEGLVIDGGFLMRPGLDPWAAAPPGGQ